MHRPAYSRTHERQRCAPVGIQIATLQPAVFWQSAQQSAAVKTCSLTPSASPSQSLELVKWHAGGAASCAAGTRDDSPAAGTSHHAQTSGHQIARPFLSMTVLSCATCLAVSRCAGLSSTPPSACARQAAWFPQAPSLFLRGWKQPSAQGQAVDHYSKGSWVLTDRTSCQTSVRPASHAECSPRPVPAPLA